jgi:NADH:ubiquinone oxidoreductase subunit E
MKPSHTIIICMGSSCFARGNRSHLTFLERFLEERGLRRYVEIRGSRCEDLCADGPTITIDGTRYCGLDEGLLMDVLDQHFPRAGQE